MFRNTTFKMVLEKFETFSRSSLELDICGHLKHQRVSAAGKTSRRLKHVLLLFTSNAVSTSLKRCPFSNKSFFWTINGLSQGSHISASRGCAKNSSTPSSVGRDVQLINQPKRDFLYCQILTNISRSFVRRRTENVFVQMAPSLAEKISNARISMVRVFSPRGAKVWEREDLNELKI